ncbi:Fe ABC transporter [Psychromonas sp. CNPT3]|uniref:ABC transporter substrate-binding protein n=1 Tax=Psychromonas sp. CNPT3 TaxID=314282 RepID=UPI00006E9563|nr:ABC transporter substrate-binding protein [Psychromonas sp. CNPT3]AGH80268.1 Fe ABC transporter [Psychromonas sp. CNPT3]
MQNIKVAIFFLLLCFFALLIEQKHGKIFALFNAKTSALTTRIEGNNYPKTLIDSTGIRFVMPKAPSRIVSVTLQSDQMLAQLVDLKRIAAVSFYADDPTLSNVVNFYPKGIPRMRAEIEQLLALQADLIFIASYTNPDTVRYLLRSHIPIIRLSAFNSLADIIDNLRLVARATDSQDKAELIILKINERLAKLSNALQGKEKVRVLYYDINGYSAGKGSLINESIEMAGGINVAKNILGAQEAKLSEERAIALQADVILMVGAINEKISGQPHSVVDILKNKSAWKNVPAIKNNRVYALPGRLLHTISQHRIEGIEQIAYLLHPEINIIKKETPHAQ